MKNSYLERRKMFDDFERDISETAFAVDVAPSQENAIKHIEKFSILCSSLDFLKRKYEKEDQLN